MAFNQNTASTQSPNGNRTSSFSTSNTGKYNINNLSYPDGISTDPDKLHYVAFFINVRGKSKVFANKPPAPNTAQGTAGENKVDTTKLGNAVVDGATVGGAVMGATAGLGIGKVLGRNAFNKALQSGSAKSANVKGMIVQYGVAAIGAIAGAVIANEATSFAVEPDTTYRISDVITLHLPHAPKYNSSVSYSEVELGTALGWASGGESASDTVKGAMNQEAIKALILSGSSSAIGNLSQSISAAASKVTGGKASGDLVTAAQATAAINIAQGKSLNPFREVLFKGAQFRKHTFSYTFMPKNKAESDNIANIIQTFRYHQAPELSSGSLYLIHPSEFTIQIYFNGEENTYFPKMATCVLMDVDVTYGGTDKFSSFNNGAPTEITMNLTFMETSLLTKDSINNGF